MTRLRLRLRRGRPALTLRRGRPALTLRRGRPALTLRRGKQLICALALLTALAAVDVAAQGPAAAPARKPAGPVLRTAEGKPNLQGHFQTDAGGANWGLEFHAAVFGLPPGRGVIVDPPDKKLPLQPWAEQERQNRRLPERGYDDPTAHCFVAAGAPRSFYVPSPLQIVQTPTHIVFLYERMSWRIVPLDNRKHLPDSVRLWQGDSVGHWDGDTLVVETTNFNGKNWLNEVGDIVSHAEQVVERFTALDADTINYRATVTDPVVYTRPWTIEMPLERQQGEILEVACHEDNQDLQHLKDIRDAFRAKEKGNGAQPEQGR